MRSEYASCAGDIFAQEGLRLPILAEHGKRGSEVEIEDEEDPFAAGPRRRSATGLDAGSPTGSVDLDDEADDLGCHERLVVGCLSSGLEPSSPGKDEARRRFVIVAVLGNLDDFLMYFSIVVSLHFCWCASVWKSTSASGAHEAIEQVSRRWRGGRRGDSARRRREILIYAQVGVHPRDDDRGHLHRDGAGHVPLVLT